MKLAYRKLSIVLILFYSTCVIFTAYILFQLQGTLVYESQVLNLSELAIAGPVFTELYLVVGFTLFIGLATLLIMQDKRNTEVIYVEKKKSATVDNHNENELKEQNRVINMAAIDEIVTKNDNELKLAREILVYMCKNLNAGIGVFYKPAQEKNKRILEIYASYALTLGESQTIKYEFGEGLVGQAALEEKTLIVDNIPEGYIRIVSGLGNAAPSHLMLVPLKAGEILYGVVEIASFTKFGNKEAQLVSAAFEKLTKKLSAKNKVEKTIPENGAEAAKGKPKKAGSIDKKNNKA